MLSPECLGLFLVHSSGDYTDGSLATFELISVRTGEVVERSFRFKRRQKFRG